MQIFKICVNFSNFILFIKKHKSMRKLLFIGLLLMFYTLTINAQQIIASSGGYFTNSNMSVSYTLGECIIETFSKTGINITQGFNQPAYSISTESKALSLDYSIEAFPNPVSNNINISVNAKGEKKLMYKIYNTQGKLLNEGNINSTKIEIPFISLPSAIYLIKIFDNNKEVKTFKIIKQR
jgi:hypothetical protein